MDVGDFNPRSLTGATHDYNYPYYKHEISIHAPSRERLQQWRKRRKTYAPFQSTLPHGSDSAAEPQTTGHGGISIHAPSRERRGQLYYVAYEDMISIHAPSRERLCLACLSHGIYKVFQSTLPHGSDVMPATCKMTILCNFNPRSLTGATKTISLGGTKEKYFNPRSLTGATSSLPSVIVDNIHFNPRSLTGATCWKNSN